MFTTVSKNVRLIIIFGLFDKIFNILTRSLIKILKSPIF